MVTLAQLKKFVNDEWPAGSVEILRRAKRMAPYGWLDPMEVRALLGSDELADKFFERANDPDYIHLNQQQVALDRQFEKDREKEQLDRMRTIAQIRE
jgi:hypothetical protein